MAFSLPRHADRQAFVRELVDHVEHAILPSVVRAILDEVVGPHVIAMLRPQPDARAVRQPQPAAFGLLWREPSAPLVSRSARRACR